MTRAFILTGFLLIGGLLFCGCGTAAKLEVDRKVSMTVTAYCSCGDCCGWKRNLLGAPVVTSGPNKGKRKAVGICADGTRIHSGVVAADTAYYPFGTVLDIPGYGRAVVHDRGAAIKGPRRLDLFFPRHQDALKWGRRELTVTVYK